MTATQDPDPKKLGEKTMRVAGLFINANSAIMVCVGLRLGLYRALNGAGPVASEDFARLTGLHERWLLEWLRGQAAAGVVDHLGGGRFELSPEAAVLLGDEDHLAYLGHNFNALPHSMGSIEAVTEAFRTGIGQSWDDRGAERVTVTEKLFRNWYRQVLVPTALPLLDGVVAKLEAGGKAADVGCGSGLALIEMAKAFPRSEFHGYEISEHCLARAEENREEAGTANLGFHNAASDPLPADASSDLVTTFDCLHDMTHPEQVAADIHASLSPEGVWFIVDVNCAPTFEENLSHPLAPMFYALSILACMSSALSEPGGAGLGTCGLPEPKMRELVKEAGFTRFRRLNLPHPANAYYEVRR